MKKDEIPQDPGVLDKFTREVCYAVDQQGKYTTELSRGWDVKTTALNVTWEDIEKRVAAAKQKVMNREASPLLFFMELKLMDLAIVAGYTGFWKWQIKRHLKPSVFEKLSDRKLQRYADVFEVSVQYLKTMNIHEG